MKRILPSAITLSGLFFAFWSMTEVVEGNTVRAAWLVFIAALLDIADGGIARALNAISAFGKDLDSLVDFCSAGVAPAFIIHAVHFEPWGWFGLFPPVVWAGFVAIRLARFNTTESRYDHYFRGVPCPPAAIVLVHYYLFSTAAFDDNGSPWVSFALILGLGGLMVSNVRYEKASWLAPSRFMTNPYGTGTVVGFAAMPFFPRQSLFVVLVLSMIRAIFRHVRSNDGPFFGDDFGAPAVALN